MQKDDKKRKKSAKSTPKNSAQPRKTTAGKPAARKPQNKATSKSTAKKPTTRANATKKPTAKSTSPKPSKATEREPNYPKDFLKDLEAAEKNARKVRAEQERKTCKKPAPSSNATKRTVEVPEGAKITDIRVHYKF